MGSQGADSLFWDFGDGFFSSLSSPVHVFQDTGQYLVTLSVYNNACGDSSNVDSLVRVCDTVISGYISSTSYLRVDAHNTAVGADSLFWDFNDGNFGSGDSISHVYTQSGLYNLKLLAFNGCGEADTSQQHILVCDTLGAGFSTYASFTTASFASTSQNADSLYWNFGDGNFASGLNPVHVYSSAGNYQVSLTAYNHCGDMQSTSDSLQICDSLQALISYNVNSDSVLFNAGSSAGASRYYWDFGDGSLDSGITALHVYGQEGIYQVTLITMNSCGDSAIQNISLELCTPPLASFSYQITNQSSNSVEVQFNGSTSINPYRFCLGFWRRQHGYFKSHASPYFTREGCRHMT